MTIFLFYLLASIAIIIGFGALYIPMIELFPIKWTYYHYHIRKPINWSILIGLIVWTTVITFQQNNFPSWAIASLLMSCFAMIPTYKLHQEVVFNAVDFPITTVDHSSLPLKKDAQIAVIEYNGSTKCYPLDYVIHHHVVNDHFNDKIVSLTYCAMCRSIIAFDVTNIGPLFVGSYKFGNMIVADRKTRTFYQQASFQSIIGELHPSTLNMIPFQILTWEEVKKISPLPQVVSVTEKDLLPFELPIPGVWKKIINSEIVPGLFSNSKDKTFPARTLIIGIIDPSVKQEVVYLKNEVLEKMVIKNSNNNFILIGIKNTVNGFKIPQNHSELRIVLQDNQLVDEDSGTRWDLRGKYLSGKKVDDLEPLAISDEYWFSWKKYHSNNTLIRL